MLAGKDSLRHADARLCLLRSVPADFDLRRAAPAGTSLGPQLLSGADKKTVDSAGLLMEVARDPPAASHCNREDLGKRWPTPEGPIDKSLGTKEALAVRLRKLSIDGEQTLQGVAESAYEQSYPESKAASSRPRLPGNELVFLTYFTTLRLTLFVRRCTFLVRQRGKEKR